MLAEQPAGLVRGFLHGAIMPLAMPGLLIGWDAEIYSPRNTGRTYKLGYTLGVDVCGAAFFGWSFRRWSRWRKSGAPARKSMEGIGKDGVHVHPAA